MGKTFDPGPHNRLQKAILEEFAPLALPRVRNAFMSATLCTETWLIYWHLNQDQLTLPTNAYLPANQGLLTPQLTPVWKPSNACLSSCKTSLFSIRFIYLNISALHSLPLSSPIPVAAGSSSQHRKKELSVAAFISCGDERSGKRTSQGLKKTPLADSDGADSTRIPASSSSLQEMSEPPSFVVKWREKTTKWSF